MTPSSPHDEDGRPRYDPYGVRLATPEELEARKVDSRRFAWRVMAFVFGVPLLIGVCSAASGSESGSEPPSYSRSTPTTSGAVTFSEESPYGSDIDHRADPGAGASTRDRCAAVMPGATSQEIADCVVLYTLMK